MTVAANGTRARSLVIAFVAGVLLSTAIGAWLTWSVQNGLDRRVTALELDQHRQPKPECR